MGTLIMTDEGHLKEFFNVKDLSDLTVSDLNSVYNHIGINYDVQDSISEDQIREAKQFFEFNTNDKYNERAVQEYKIDKVVIDAIGGQFDTDNNEVVLTSSKVTKFFENFASTKAKQKLKELDMQTNGLKRGQEYRVNFKEIFQNKDEKENS